MTTQPEQQTTGPEVVAWHVVGGDGTDEPWVYRDANDTYEAEAYTLRYGGTIQPLVTLPDALAHAEAQVREAEARIVAWLRGASVVAMARYAAEGRKQATVTAAFESLAIGIERNEHRA